MADRFRTGLDWEDARVFVALARHGSLSATARALGVNHATVARRIRTLEATLGARLFDRRSDGYGLTAAGLAALEAAEAMEKAADRLAAAPSAPVLSGLVRISATPSLADGFLVPRLSDLAARHPGIDLEIIAERRLASLARREADIALRLGGPKDGAVVARRLATVGFGYYATPAHAERLAAGATPVFVGFDAANAHLPEATFLARHFPRARLAFRANSQLTQALAAAAGLGVALLPHFLGAPTPGLVAVDIELDCPSRPLVALTQPMPPHEGAVRTVRDALVEMFAAASGLFATNGT